MCIFSSQNSFRSFQVPEKKSTKTATFVTQKKAKKTMQWCLIPTPWPGANNDVPTQEDENVAWAEHAVRNQGWWLLPFTGVKRTLCLWHRVQRGKYTLPDFFFQPTKPRNQESLKPQKNTTWEMLFAHPTKRSGSKQRSSIGRPLEGLP